MATHVRDGIYIVSRVEELDDGQYRGQLAFDAHNRMWLYRCADRRVTPLDARADADAAVESAYAQFLADGPTDAQTDAR